jgi:hypothetical protein
MVLISVVAVVMGSLFVTAYSLALGDPVPHHIKAALVGDPAAGPRTIAAVEKVADDKLVFERYSEPPAALNAVNHQNVYAALDLGSSRPTLHADHVSGAFSLPS